MKYFIRTYLPSTCILFTIITCSNIIFNLATQSSAVVSSLFLVEVLGLIVICHILEYLICLIPFKTLAGYYLSTTAAYCTVVLLAVWFTPWIDFRADVVIYSIVILLLNLLVLRLYFKVQQEHTANEINRLLEKNQD